MAKKLAQTENEAIHAKSKIESKHPEAGSFIESIRSKKIKFLRSKIND